MKCDRCNTHAPELEELTFKSVHKQTTLQLCGKCFLDARSIFAKWFLEGGNEIPNSKVETSDS